MLRNIHVNQRKTKYFDQLFVVDPDYNGVDRFKDKLKVVYEIQ